MDRLTSRAVARLGVVLHDRQRRILLSRRRDVPALLGSPTVTVIDTGRVLVRARITSACVTRCDAAQLIVPPGANVDPFAGVHVPSTAFASVTVTLLSVVLPVFVTRIV